MINGLDVISKAQVSSNLNQEEVVEEPTLMETTAATLSYKYRPIIDKVR